jgi:putative transposase
VASPERPESLRRALGRAHADYARYRNLIDRSCGHVWEARYFSCPLERAHLWRGIAYVERNPVRAGMVANAEEYPWSSARARLGGTRPQFLDLTAWQAEYDARRWRQVLADGVDEETFQQRIREASMCGRPLGSDEFAERLEMEAGRRLRPNPRGRPKKEKKGKSILSLF